MNAFRMALVLTTLVMAAPSSQAADLDRIDRSIVREPLYRSGEPKYALVVLGPEASTRLWLVADGDRLYVDRNGNGDLTESDELVSGSLSHEGLVARFMVPGLTAWEGKSAALRVTLTGETGFNDDLHFVLDGKPFQSVSFDDQDSFRFAARPQDAPIVHFGGPLQMSLRIEQSLRRGRRASLMTMIGTPGRGDGTFAALDYPMVPSGVNPVAEIEFPSPVPGKDPIRSTVSLDHRCCTCNFQAEVWVPEELNPGKARITLSFPAWTEAQVNSTTVEVRIK